MTTFILVLFFISYLTNFQCFQIKFYFINGKYIIIKIMKTQSIEILHKGNRRKINKLEYSKIRPYNKIKTSRVNNSDSSTFSESQMYGTKPICSSRSVQRKFTQEELFDIIQCLKKDNRALSEEIIQMGKLIKKEEKIDRVLLKKFGENYFQYQIQRNIEKKDLIGMLQIKLALQVIQLQSELQQKNYEYNLLSNPRKRNQDIKQLKEAQCIKRQFLNMLFTASEKLIHKEGQFKEKIQKTQYSIHNLNNKLKLSKKNKENQQKILQQLSYQLKQMQQQIEQRKNKARKDSYQYIQIQNGQVKNQQDLKNQIINIKKQRNIQGDLLQQFLQRNMKEKIILINQIQNLEDQCKKIGIAYKNYFI